MRQTKESVQAKQIAEANFYRAARRRGEALRKFTAAAIKKEAAEKAFCETNSDLRHAQDAFGAVALELAEYL